MPNHEKLITVCYYAITTLSTVGYGDLFPINNAEMILGIFVMLIGVAYFSYIMGNFITIIQQYDEKMGNVDHS
jgi:hypothetical protein